MSFFLFPRPDLNIFKKRYGQKFLESSLQLTSKHKIIKLLQSWRQAVVMKFSTKPKAIFTVTKRESVKGEAGGNFRTSKKKFEGRVQTLLHSLCYFRTSKFQRKNLKEGFRPFYIFFCCVAAFSYLFSHKSNIVSSPPRENIANMHKRTYSDF